MSDPKAAIRIVLQEPDAAAAAITGGALSQNGSLKLLAVASDEASLLEEVSRSRPDVVVVELTVIGNEPSGTVREILARVPECCIIVTGSNVPAFVVARAVTAGARGFLLKPYQNKDLIATIEDAYLNLAELRRLQRAEKPALPVPVARGSIIVVYSPKGGVGCTTIATNLAVALAGRAKNVALVDLDLQFGDVGILLDIRSANSITDLIAHVDSIDDTLIEDVFVRHETGVRALLAPDNPGFADAIDPDRLVRVLSSLRERFDYVICDLWSNLDDLTVATLRTADRIVLVTTPELPALKNLRRAISATAPLLLDDRTFLIANRVPGKAGISIADIERGIGRSVTATIPSEGVGVTEAINQGISILDSRAKARTGRSYRKLADLMLRDAPRQPVARPREAAPGVA